MIVSKLRFPVILFLFTALAASTCLAGETEFTFKSSFDNSEQKAVAYIPDTVKKTEPRPLLVVAHFMGGNRFTAKNGGYYPECDSRGWLCVCPELHGHRSPGQISCASLEAQHDIMDSIAWIKTQCAVDSSRIYIVGRSMGGMLGGLMAAKYPDVFAAVVAGQGIYDLKLWRETTTPGLRANVDKECLPYSPAVRFDYERRSAVSFARNLAYTPLIMWHGTWDTWVPPEQAERLLTAVKQHTRFLPEMNWLLNAAHCPRNFDTKWELDRLEYYQNVCEAGFDTPTRFFPTLNIITDEAKPFYWLTITPAQGDRFATVNASLEKNAVTIVTGNVRDLAIDIDKISKTISCATYSARSDVPCRVTFTKGGKTVFEATGKQGTLPADLFKR